MVVAIPAEGDVVFLRTHLLVPVLPGPRPLRLQYIIQQFLLRRALLLGPAVPGPSRLRLVILVRPAFLRLTVPRRKRRRWRSSRLCLHIRTILRVDENEDLDRRAYKVREHWGLFLGKTIVNHRLATQMPQKRERRSGLGTLRGYITTHHTMPHRSRVSFSPSPPS